MVAIYGEFGIRLEDPSVGSLHSLFSAGWSWEEFFRMPLETTLYLRYAGGAAQTERGGGRFFALGGKPQQDLLDAIINSTRVGAVWLHGYSPGVVSGNQFHLFNLEYRIPLTIIEKGLSTLPFYVRRAHLTGLFDAGTATNGKLDFGDIRTALGASLRLDVVFGYYVGGTFDFGYSHGFGPGGTDEFWLLLTGGI